MKKVFPDILSALMTATALREAAENKEFDILLVFMFDRLGRIDYETPFVLKWFVEQGIEVWSVKEGQQTFDKHEDDLVNYIRFWTANVERKRRPREYQPD